MKEIDWENIRIELIDELHFWVSKCQLVGLNPHNLTELYVKKNKLNQVRQDKGYGSTYSKLDNNGVANILIRNCYFHDNHFHLFTDSTKDWIIENNYFKKNYNNGEDESHQENGMKAYGAENMTIRYNLWEDNSGSGTIWFACGNQLGNSDDIDVRNVFIYGNAFYYSDESQFGNTMGTIAIASDARPDDLVDNFNVYNNAFVNLNGLRPGVRAEDGITTITNYRVYNNIFYIEVELKYTMTGQTYIN